MSKIYSFRLNPDNPREAEALTILHSWITQGFSTRHTMTEALLNLDSARLQKAEYQVNNELTLQIMELLNIIESGLLLSKMTDKINPKIELSDKFVSSIEEAVKPGMRNTS